MSQRLQWTAAAGGHKQGERESSSYPINVHPCLSVDQDMCAVKETVGIRVYSGDELQAVHEEWRQFVGAAGWQGCHCLPEWTTILGEAFNQKPFVIFAMRDNRIVGVLPLLFVRSRLFGRFLVSLPYVLNWGGVISEDDEATRGLLDQAVILADELDVRYLELRHEKEFEHPALSQSMNEKVQMRMQLAESDEAAWKKLRSVVRTQVRKAEGLGLTVQWGREELLRDFYTVFAHNMRDLGTPVYTRRLFELILAKLPDSAELCVVRLGQRPVASALAIHNDLLTEVPTASSLRKYRDTAANSLMYWRLIQRAIERGQEVFDFGRSTRGCGTYIFKKKWGAKPQPAVWQYYVREGSASDMRPDNGKYDRAVKVWQRLPVALARIVGPHIVRGIP